MDKPTKTGTNAPEGKPAKAEVPERKSYSEAQGADAISALLFSDEGKGKPKRGTQKAEETPTKKPKVPEKVEPDSDEDGESDEDFTADDEDSDTPTDASDEDDKEDGDDDAEEDGDEEDSDEDDDDVEEHADGGRKFRHPKTGETLTLNELFNGYLRTADYTRKTQVTAKERKEIQDVLKPELESIRSERVALADKLKLIDKALQETTVQEPDWERVKAEDPDSFAELYAVWDLHKKRQAQLKKDIDDADKKVTEDNKRQYVEHMREQNALLIEAMPGWSESPEKAKEDFDAILKYGKSLGYTDEQLGGVTDHRLFIFLNKARKWDAAQKKGKGTKAPLTPKSAKPGSAVGEVSTKKRKQGEFARAKQRAAKTGRISDAASAISHILQAER